MRKIVFYMRKYRINTSSVGVGTEDENPKKREKTMPHEIAQIFYAFPKPKVSSN